MSSLCLDTVSVGQECVIELVLFWTLLYIQIDSSQPGIAGKFTKPPELCFLLELPFKFLAHLPIFASSKQDNNVSLLE